MSQQRGRPPTPVTAERACSNCGDVFPFTLQHFYRCQTGVGGLDAMCKVCRRLRKRASYSSSRPVLLAARAARRKNARPLKPGQRCHECFGQAHRVDGAECWRCGLQYAPEPALDLRDYLYRHPERVLA